MEDCDWTDLPSTSSAVLAIDENYITDSSPEISEVKKSVPQNEGDVFVAEKTKGDTSSSQVDVKKKNQGASNDKQDKESCPICLSSFEDRSFLDQCFHILFL
jgi:hypothetical protein